MTAIELLGGLNRLDANECIKVKARIVVSEAGAIDNATYRELNKVDALATSGALRWLRVWRVEELALLLHRNSRHMRNIYPRSLMLNRRLVMTNPDALNDPQHVYRVEEGGQ